MRLVNTDDWTDNGEIHKVIKELSNVERWELFVGGLQKTSVG